MARVKVRALIGRAKSDESGMTLLELVVAFLIFGILMLGIAHTMGTGLSMTRTNRHRSVAANLAAERMDTIRSMDFASIAAATQNVDVDGMLRRTSRNGRDAVIACPIDERSTSGATTRTFPNSDATAASTAIPGL